MTALDIALILIFVIGIFIGWAKGFFAIITKPIKIILAAILTYLTAAAVIEGWTGPYFQNLLGEKINLYLVEKCPDIASAEGADVLPSVLRLAAKIFSVDLSAATGSGSDLINELSAILAVPLGSFVATVVTYVAGFFVFLIALSLVVSVFSAIFRSGVLRIVDSSAGLLLMAGVSFMLSCLVATMVANVAPEFEGGVVYVFFRDFDPIGKLMSI
jgi:hypothetical protein